jgi:hypothetical protein
VQFERRTVASIGCARCATSDPTGKLSPYLPPLNPSCGWVRRRFRASCKITNGVAEDMGLIP